MSRLRWAALAGVVSTAAVLAVQMATADQARANGKVLAVLTLMWLASVLVAPWASQRRTLRAGAR